MKHYQMGAFAIALIQLLNFPFTALPLQEHQSNGLQIDRSILVWHSFYSNMARDDQFKMVKMSKTKEMDLLFQTFDYQSKRGISKNTK